MHELARSFVTAPSKIQTKISKSHSKSCESVKNWPGVAIGGDANQLYAL